MYWQYTKNLKMLLLRYKGIIINYTMAIPLVHFIETRKTELGDNEFTFAEFKDQLVENLGNGLTIKEDNDVALIYYDGCGSDSYKSLTPENQELAISLRSCIIDKSTLEVLATQYNNIIYNEDAVEYVKRKSWNNIVISKCHEGTLVTVFYHKKWYVCTRRCLDSNTSKWGTKTYGELFNETLDFDFEELDKNYFYLFIIVHHDNNNIIKHSPGTQKLLLCNVTEKVSLRENFEYKYLDKDELEFSNIDDVFRYLHNINRNDIRNKTISSEGLILKVYDGEKHKSPFKILKLQTHIYRKVAEAKPNTSNIYHILLNFYQNDQLSKLVRYFTDDLTITNKIDKAIKDLAQEILNIYHITRNKNNEELYGALTSVYKKVLYDLHGQFKLNKRSVGVHDVYYYLKGIETTFLRKLLIERPDTIKEFKSSNIYNIAQLLK